MASYQKQTEDFLKKANATCDIKYGGCAVNPNRKEKEMRNFYTVTLSTPIGSMEFDFWDSIHNTEISKMSVGDYAKRKRHMQYKDLTLYEKLQLEKELDEKKAKAKPTVYDVLACMTTYDPGTFEEFYSEFGYDDDSISAYKIYMAVIKKYKELSRIFTQEQLDELSEIQ